jgi:hypothetical protein
LGHPLGEPDNPAQQRTLIFDALRLLIDAEQPGMIVDPGYRWRRTEFHEPDWSQLNPASQSA